MAAYSYEAINAQGLRQYGNIHAADLASAREQLRSRGLLAQTLREQAASGETGTARFKKVKPRFESADRASPQSFDRRSTVSFCRSSESASLP